MMRAYTDAEYLAMKVKFLHIPVSDDPYFEIEDVLAELMRRVLLLEAGRHIPSRDAQ